MFRVSRFVRQLADRVSEMQYASMPLLVVFYTSDRIANVSVSGSTVDTLGIIV
jgi:hypothetical protein